MRETNLEETGSFFGNVFGVFFKEQTYLNLVYLLLSFGLGIAYFTILLTGIALGIGLVVIWIGIPILLTMLVITRGLAAFERELARRMLGMTISTENRPERVGRGFFGNLLALITNPTTWKELFYLFAKFPLGVASFVVVTVCITVPLALLSAPIIYQFVPVRMGFYNVDSLGAALSTFVLGVLAAIVLVRVLNLTAKISGLFAQMMLGSSRW